MPAKNSMQHGKEKDGEKIKKIDRKQPHIKISYIV